MRNHAPGGDDSSLALKIRSGGADLLMLSCDAQYPFMSLESELAMLGREYLMDAVAKQNLKCLQGEVEAFGQLQVHGVQARG